MLINPKTMIKISLTDFVDYVSKVGTSKYTIVNKINARDDYHPAFDFWKPLREGIIELHKDRGDKKVLDDLLKSLTDKKKQNRYPLLIKQYKSFLGRKKIEWFDPPHKEWKEGNLSVRLNPELGLEINGEYTVIKLYFKSDKLSQMKADLILLLMNEKFKKKDYKDVTFAVLDVANKKMFNSTKLGKAHMSLLEGEALSFIKIWESIE